MNSSVVIYDHLLAVIRILSGRLAQTSSRIIISQLCILSAYNQFKESLLFLFLTSRKDRAYSLVIGLRQFDSRV